MTYQEANKLIDPQEKFQVEIEINDKTFIAEFHRARYYYYEVPTPEKTKELKQTWHVTYWQCLGNSGSRCEIAWNNPYNMAYGPLEFIKVWVKDKLELLAKHHIKYVSTI